MPPPESPVNPKLEKKVSFYEVNDSLPPCPLVGCSLAFLDFCALHWSQKHKFSDQITMGALCNELIKPSTTMGSKDQEYIRVRGLHAALQEGLLGHPASAGEDAVEFVSFAELAMREKLLDSRGKPAFAKATHFVSHAWRYVFTPFVEALNHWVDTNNISQDGLYFWVDALVVNQHQSQNYPQEWWSTRFMQAVGEIGNTILVLDPWDDPLALKRAWVIWELYCTSVTGAKLHVTMRPEAMNDFNSTLVTSFDSVQTALSRVDCATSEAFHKSDEDMIHEEIRRTIGFTKLNEMVQMRLMQWLTETAKTRLQVMRSEEMGAISKAPAISRINLENNLARMCRETGSVVEAEGRFEALLAEVAEKLGPEDLFTLNCMNQLAVTYQKNGKTEKALQTHRKCLKHRVQVLGLEHADSLQSTSNLAVLLCSKKPLTLTSFEESEMLFRQAIIGREKNNGENHPTTLYTVSNLGKLLSEAPEDLNFTSTDLFEEAEAMHKRAVDRLTEALHGTHPLTLTAMHNQGCHWFAFFRFQEHLGLEADSRLLFNCEEQLHSVHNARTGKLGKQHPDTLLTEQMLNNCSNYEKAPKNNEKTTETHGMCCV